MSEESWTFTYEGPISPAPDGDCPVCAAVATKKCWKGASAHDVPGASAAENAANRMHCPSCFIERRLAAKKEVWCPNHCGIRTALETHTISNAEGGPDEQRASHPSFAAFSAAVLGIVASLPAAQTRAEVTGDGTVDLADSKGFIPMVTVGGERVRYDYDEPGHKGLVPEHEPTSSPSPLYGEFRMHVRVPRATK
jgi:hypothetical protein